MNPLPFSPLTLHELNNRVDRENDRAAGYCKAVVSQTGSIANCEPYDARYIDEHFRAADTWHEAAMVRVRAEDVAR